MTLASPPAPGSYRFVLRETIHNPETMQTFVGYDEVADSRAILHPDGVTACTIFVFGESTASRARKKGWIDVTDEWMAQFGDLDAPKASAEVERVEVESEVESEPVDLRTRRAPRAPGKPGAAEPPPRQRRA